MLKHVKEWRGNRSLAATFLNFVTTINVTFSLNEFVQLKKMFVQLCKNVLNALTFDTILLK
jgi:hypothetical protein